MWGFPGRRSFTAFRGKTKRRGAARDSLTGRRRKQRPEPRIKQQAKRQVEPRVEQQAKRRPERRVEQQAKRRPERRVE